VKGSHFIIIVVIYYLFVCLFVNLLGAYRNTLAAISHIEWKRSIESVGDDKYSADVYKKLFMRTRVKVVDHSSRSISIEIAFHE